MLILSRVCADFYDARGTLIHRIRPADLGLFHDAPEAIKQDPLFRMLANDGSIKFPEDAAKDRNLEQDPMKGATADGRETAVASKVTKQKTENVAETKVASSEKKTAETKAK